MIEKGRTDQIIEQLIDSVENGQNVPFAPGKVSVNKEETIRLLRELENIVQGELKIYREVNDRKGKILTEAKKEAEEILTQAEQERQPYPCDKTDVHTSCISSGRFGAGGSGSVADCRRHLCGIFDLHR